MDENQKALLLLGVAAVLYFDNKSVIRKILTKVKEEGMESEFQQVLGKGYELRKAFLAFMQSLDTSIRSFYHRTKFWAGFTHSVTSIPDFFIGQDIPITLESLRVNLVALLLIFLQCRVHLSPTVPVCGLSQ